MVFDKTENVPIKSMETVFSKFFTANGNNLSLKSHEDHQKYNNLLQPQPGKDICDGKKTMHLPNEFAVTSFLGETKVRIQCRPTIELMTSVPI